MVIPVGGVYEVQDFVLVTKDEKGVIKKQSLMRVKDFLDKPLKADILLDIDMVSKLLKK